MSYVLIPLNFRARRTEKPQVARKGRRRARLLENSCLLCARFSSIEAVPGLLALARQATTRPSGYKFTGGYAGDSYANVRGRTIDNALSDALLHK